MVDSSAASRFGFRQRLLGCSQQVAPTAWHGHSLLYMCCTLHNTCVVHDDRRRVRAPPWSWCTASPRPPQECCWTQSRCAPLLPVWQLLVVLSLQLGVLQPQAATTLHTCQAS